MSRIPYWRSVFDAVTVCRDFVHHHPECCRPLDPGSLYRNLVGFVIRRIGVDRLALCNDENLIASYSKGLTGQTPGTSLARIYNNHPCRT